MTGARSDEPPVPGALAVFSGEHALLAAIPLERGQVVLGRDEALRITDDRVSRQHAVVTLERGHWKIRDEGSRNGTFVNGARVDGTAAVESPHVVRLAYSIYLMCDDLRPFLGATVEVTGDRVIGPTFAAALDRVRRAGDSVLVLGESGVGKELAAREFHGGKGPFVSVNCATIPESVAERLLFGSVRGSFSGAVDAEGSIVAADGGVLFLDELAELDPAVQAKLLRVLETREVVPLGATRGRTVTTRFCFATLRNLRAAMAEDEFRPDLYYRVARTEVHLPALRERREEVPWLVCHELGSARAHARLVEACLLRPWPGNVRELRTALRAAAERSGDGVVRAEHLDPAAGGVVAAPAPASARPQDITREQLIAAIAAERGNLSAVARALGLHRSQLYRLLEQHGIER